jgi:pimeloyl-ACP methyl ester carboxylesterase
MTDQPLHVETGGSGRPTLLLLHGLGAHGRVWDGVVERLPERWPGRWIVPDLPGHGRSAPAGNYGIGCQAARLAELVGDGAGDLVVCGHSLGGLVALALSTGWYRVSVSHVLAIGVKITWSEAELARIEEFAASPTRWFDTREAATERFLKVSGLIGLVPPDGPIARTGVVEEDGRFRLAAEQRTITAGAPSIDRCMAASEAEVSLMCGSADALVGIDELRARDPEAVELRGLGHNVMVEDPDAVVDRICRFALPG